MLADLYFDDISEHYNKCKQPYKITRAGIRFCDKCFHVLSYPHHVGYYADSMVIDKMLKDIKENL